MIRKVLLTVALVGLAGVHATQASTIVVLNPSFEANLPATPGYGTINDWTRSTNAIGVNNIGAVASAPFLNGQTPRDANRAAFIQDGGNISQSLSGFDPTKLYSVTYFVSERGHPNSSASIKTSVSLDGGSTSFNYADTIKRTDKFRRVVSTPLAVTGASSTLQISSVDQPGDSSLLIDAVTVTRAVPVVNDGGFERHVLNANAFEIAGVDNTVGTSPWTFGPNSGITRNGSAFAPALAPEGSQAGILRSDIHDISQVISGFEAGVSYSLSFEADGRDNNLGPTSFSVWIGSTKLTFGGNDIITPAQNVGYNSFTSDAFTTTGGAFTLLFDGLTSGDKTTFLDDIRFNFVAEAPANPIPEPASALMGLAGLALIALRRSA